MSTGPWPTSSGLRAASVPAAGGGGVGGGGGERAADEVGGGRGGDEEVDPRVRDEPGADLPEEGDRGREAVEVVEVRHVLRGLRAGDEREAGEQRRVGRLVARGG